MRKVSFYITVEFLCFGLKNSILYFTLIQVRQGSYKDNIHKISMYL